MSRKFNSTLIARIESTYDGFTLIGILCIVVMHMKWECNYSYSTVSDIDEIDMLFAKSKMPMIHIRLFIKGLIM